MIGQVDYWMFAQVPMLVIKLFIWDLSARLNSSSRNSSHLEPWMPLRPGRCDGETQGSRHEVTFSSDSIPILPKPIISRKSLQWDSSCTAAQLVSAAVPKWASQLTYRRHVNEHGAPVGQLAPTYILWQAIGCEAMKAVDRADRLIAGCYRHPHLGRRGARGPRFVDYGPTARGANTACDLLPKAEVEDLDRPMTDFSADSWSKTSRIRHR